MSEEQHAPPPQGPKQDLEITLPATSATSATGSKAPQSKGAAAGSYAASGTPGSRAHVRVTLKHTVQDLCDDKLILAAKRLDYDARLVPSLGDIPLLAKLGQGGMGAVYYGLHPRLNKEVAVKVLPFNLVDKHPEMVDRFFREAQLASNVQSPHLVAVTDVNEESGLFYLVMEYVHGTTGGGYLRGVCEGGLIGLPETEALDICIAATAGLAAAHAAGIIHRDVKPENILIPRQVATNHGHQTPAPDGAGWKPAPQTPEFEFRRSKLSDLGLARTEEFSQSLTGTELCMGTPGYMSPEQAMDAKTCGKPADIFSMGATLYALLTGNAPFRESTLMRVLLATRNEPYPAIHAIRSDISAPTINLIDRCLAKDPSQRFADGAALLEAITLCRKGIIEPARDSQTTIKEVARISLTPEAGQHASSPSTYVGQHPDTQSATPTAISAAAMTPTLIGQTPAMTPAHPIRWGRWVAAGLAFVLAGAGALFLHHQQQFKSDLSRAIVGGKTAAGKSGDELSHAIEALEAVADPEANHHGVDVQDAQELLASLKTRRDMLDKRKAEFDRLLAESQKLGKSTPVAAFKGLTHAEEFGAADAEKGVPDLLGTAQPGIPMLKMDLRSSMEHREKKFETNADAAKKAKADQDWAKAQECAEQAIKVLADIKRPDKAEVETLLNEANETRDAFGYNVHEGERLLKAGEFANAKAAFEKAKAAWEKSPDIAKADEGIAAADKGLTDKR